MKTLEPTEARRMFAAELRHLARSQHGKDFAELTNAQGAKLVHLVSDQHPDWRSALDHPLDDRPPVAAPDWSVDELRADSRVDRERDAANAYGFSEDAIRADPLRRDMVQTAAFFAERDARAADLDQVVDQVARELAVDSRTHDGRCRVFAELARRRHPLATSRRFERI
jgi:hypothetical protein